MQNEYFINQITDHSISSNKNIYLDSFDGDIKINNTKWDFNLNFYFIHNSFLPTNIFELTLELPFAKAENIEINQITTQYIPHWVDQKDLCKIYNANFSIFTNSNIFNLGDIELLNIELKTLFNFNPNVDLSILNASQDSLNLFNNELRLIDEMSSFDYSNCIDIGSNSGIFYNCKEIYVNSKSGWYHLDDEIYIENLKNSSKILTDIAEIYTSNPIFIKKIKYDFIYYISEVKNEYYYEQSINNSLSHHLISFDKNLLFNTTSFQFQESNNGINGLFIPLDAYGILNIEIQYMDSNNNYKVIKLNKNASFIKEDGLLNKISKKEISITDTSDYETKEYYD